MATCSDIVTRALRRLRIIDERESPTAEHGVAGMAALNGLFDRYEVPRGQQAVFFIPSEG